MSTVRQHWLTVSLQHLPLLPAPTPPSQCPARTITGFCVQRENNSKSQWNQLCQNPQASSLPSPIFWDPITWVLISGKGPRLWGEGTYTGVATSFFIYNYIFTINADLLQSMTLKNPTHAEGDIDNLQMTSPCSFPTSQHPLVPYPRRYTRSSRMSWIHLWGLVQVQSSPVLLFPPDRPQDPWSSENHQVAGWSGDLFCSRAKPKKWSSLVRLGLSQRDRDRKKFCFHGRKRGKGGEWREVGMQRTCIGAGWRKWDHYEGTQVRLALQDHMKSVASRKQKAHPPHSSLVDPQDLLPKGWNANLNTKTACCVLFPYHQSKEVWS